MAWVSQHAVARYIERISPHLTPEAAKAEIMQSAAMVDAAARFGANTVKRPDGARLVLQGDCVVTIKTAHTPHNPPSSTQFKRWRRNAAARHVDQA